MLAVAVADTVIDAAIVTAKIMRTVMLNGSRDQAATTMRITTNKPMITQSRFNRTVCPPAIWSFTCWAC